MSKPVKNLITETYRKKFANQTGGVIIEVRGVNAAMNNAVRGALAKDGIKVTVVKNSLAKRAWQGTSMAGLTDLLEGSCAVVYGSDSVVNVARALVEQLKAHETLTFKGALMDGVVFKAEQIKELAKYPTRVEAQGQIVTIILTPAKKLAGQIVAPGRKLASIIKTIQEKLEKGETIAKVA